MARARTRVTELGHRLQLRLGVIAAVGVCWGERLDKGCFGAPRLALAGVPGVVFWGRSRLVELTGKRDAILSRGREDSWESRDMYGNKHARREFMKCRSCELPMPLCEAQRGSARGWKRRYPSTNCHEIAALQAHSSIPVARIELRLRCRYYRLGSVTALVDHDMFHDTIGSLGFWSRLGRTRYVSRYVSRYVCSLVRT